MNETEIILEIYRGLISLRDGNCIHVQIRPSAVVGTVQDDPFDCWVSDVIKHIMPSKLEIYHSGPLTTPDLIVRDCGSGTIIGIEVKKLVQVANGRDPRGLTIDYNSSLPCGKTLIKVGEETRVIPCFYLFALLNQHSTKIVSLILLDGDFMNYDFELYKEAKYANTSEYNHGPYGEGSVRHRRMYTYPNPLHSKLPEFYQRMILILKKHDFERIPSARHITQQIIRADKYGNSFYYSILDETTSEKSHNSPMTLTGIFDACKARNAKERIAYIPTIPKP